MSVELWQIAVISETPRISLDELMPVCAALQKQVARDLAPVWDVQATVSPFATLQQMGDDYWPIVIQDTTTHPNVLGYHYYSGAPAAVVAFQPNWSLAVSHECLEILIDPSGNHTLPGPSIRPDAAGEQVEYLLEICDPCQDATSAYCIDGVAVSDFCYPEYYGLTNAAAAGRFNFCNSISRRYQLLAGGYLSFRDRLTHHWFKATLQGRALKIVDVGLIPETSQSLREQVDRMDRHAVRRGKEKKRRSAKAAIKIAPALLRQQASIRKAAAAAGEMRAKRLHRMLEQLAAYPEASP